MPMQLSHGLRLNARTTPRIHRATKVLVNRLAMDGVTFSGRIISIESLISGLLKAYLDLPYDSQKKLMLQILPELQRDCDATNLDTDTQA